MSQPQPDPEAPVLRAEGLYAAYDGTQVLCDVNLSVGVGAMLGIIGPNGSGKSTLLRCFAGTLKPTAGRVLLFDTDVATIPVRQRARLVAVVPQHTTTSFAFTVWDTVAMGRHAHLGLMQALTERDIRAVSSALEQTDCIHLADRLITELSGGELQRVIIARALAQEPQVLLLDEPTSHLDINHQLDIAALLGALNADRRLTVLWVTHDLNLASEFCERIVLLSNGHVAADGDPLEVITQRQLAAVYNTELTVMTNPLSGRPQVVITASKNEARR